MGCRNSRWCNGDCSECNRYQDDGTEFEEAMWDKADRDYESRGED